MNNWWKRLDERRKDLGWSNTELARRAGLDRSIVQKYLDGKVENPRGNAMEKLAKAVGRPVTWLRYGIEPQPVDLSAEERAFIEKLRDLPEESQENILRITNDLYNAAKASPAA